MGETSPNTRGVVAPRHLHLPRGRRVRELLSGRVGKLAAAAIADTVVALLFLPPAAYLMAGIWGLVAYLRGLVMAWRVLTHWQTDAFFARLSAVDLAAHVGLTGGAYFALLLALIVVFAGLLGHRPRRWFLLPGIALALPAVGTFLFAATTTHTAAAARFHLPGVLGHLLTAYAIADAVALAALLLDMRPSRRQRRSTARPLRSAPITRPIPRLEALPAQAQPEVAPLAHGAASGTPSATQELSTRDDGAPPPAGDEPAAHDGPAQGLTA